MICVKGGGEKMTIGESLKSLREQHGFTQEELAHRLHITRQAVSRWENGETEPNTESLKLISRLFNVSINTLLGAPRQLICQCCGMPLHEDEFISREPDGSLREDYCRWCYMDGGFVYQDLDSVIHACVPNMVKQYDMSEQAARRMLLDTLPGLAHWRGTAREE